MNHATPALEKLMQDAATLTALAIAAAEADADDATLGAFLDQVWEAEPAQQRAALRLLLTAHRERLDKEVADLIERETRGWMRPTLEEIEAQMLGRFPDPEPEEDLPGPLPNEMQRRLEELERRREQRQLEVQRLSRSLPSSLPDTLNGFPVHRVAGNDYALHNGEPYGPSPLAAGAAEMLERIRQRLRQQNEPLPLLPDPQGFTLDTSRAVILVDEAKPEDRR